MRKNRQRKITMTLLQTLRPNRITLYASKQGMRSTEVGALAPVFEKLAPEPKPNPKLLRYNIVSIVIFNVRNLNSKIVTGAESICNRA